jgi:CheY-like chemotaxis protein
MEAGSKKDEPIRVLFVEDEFLISEWVTQELAEQGFTVRTATNAADALRQLAASRVDVLFTDINLPGGMDGTALARRARELQPDLPVVYASARANWLSPDRRVPGSTFVPKPYEPSLVGRLLAAASRVASAASPA